MNDGAWNSRESASTIHPREEMDRESLVFRLGARDAERVPFLSSMVTVSF